MMKYVLALVLLLHLCYSSKTNRALNREIIKNLKDLDKVYTDNKASITLPDTMRVPSTDMHDNASSCVGIFIRELRAILNNMVVPQNSTSTLIKLQANLNFLGQHGENDQECRMIESTTSLTPFSTYAAFLRTLNHAKRK